MVTINVSSAVFVHQFSLHPNMYSSEWKYIGNSTYVNSEQINELQFISDLACTEISFSLYNLTT